MASHAGASDGSTAKPTARFLLARAAVGCLVALLVLVPGAAGAPVPPGVAGGILLWIGAGTLLVRRGGPLRRWPGSALGLLLSGDTLAAAVASWAAGGLGAPGLLLIALPVLAGGLLLEWGVGLLLGVLAGVLCGMLPGSSVHAGAGPPGSSELWGAIVYHAGIFVALGLAAGLLGRRMASSLCEAAGTRSALEAERLSTDRMVESLSCGLLALDARGGLQRINRAGRALLGRGSGERVDWARLEAGNPDFAGLLQACLQGAPLDGDRELELRSAEGRVYPASVKVAPVIDADGRARGLVALFWDLSERRALEETARRGERLAAVGEVAAGLAHEIRNSLKPITGCIELLAKREGIDAGSQPMIDVITQEAESLEAFLSQFLALAQDKCLKLESVDLEELIEKEIQTLVLGGKARRFQVTLMAAPEKTVRGDREWLRRIFRNLILNALEADPEGRVRVTIEAAPEGARPGVRVRVCDEGPGFTALEFGEALRPFETGKPAGTGLGLPIALRGVQEHDGRLWLDPSYARGAGLVIELPVAGPTAASARSWAA